MWLPHAILFNTCLAPHCLCIWKVSLATPFFDTAETLIDRWRLDDTLFYVAAIVDIARVHRIWLLKIWLHLLLFLSQVLACNLLNSLIAFELVHEMLVSDLLSGHVLVALRHGLLPAVIACATKLYHWSVCCHVSELGWVFYLGCLGWLSIHSFLVHSLSCLIYQSPCILHMSRHGGIDLSLAIILHRIGSKLSTFTTYKRFAFLIDFMICNIDKRLDVIGTSSTVWLVIIFLSWRVLMGTRIIQAVLWRIYDRTLTSTSPTLLGIRALILWLLRPLWGPGKSTHCVWEFTLSFSNDFERLFLILE